VGSNHEVHLEDAFSIIPPTSRFWRHAKAPSNIGTCIEPHAQASAVGSCGDSISVELRVENDVLEEIKCAPRGCVYTFACASAMSELAAGRTIEQALQIQPEDVAMLLDGLPEDHLHCARLAVNTLGEAIAEYYRRAASSGGS
jgi:nitrogen fixation NifU-like protein